MIIGGYWEELQVGQIVDVIDRHDKDVVTARGRVLGPSTREEYLKQQEERGRLPESGFSVGQYAPHFYRLAVD